jgi:hypothetical protein
MKRVAAVLYHAKAAGESFTGAMLREGRCWMKRYG